MRGKVAKEIRKFLKETQSNLLKPESKALYKKIYNKIKKQYKATPWNQKHQVIVK